MSFYKFRKFIKGIEMRVIGYSCKRKKNFVSWISFCLEFKFLFGFRFYVVVGEGVLFKSLGREVVFDFIIFTGRILSSLVSFFYVLLWSKWVVLDDY